MTVQELAEWLGAEFAGDGAAQLTGVADLGAAGAGQLAFVQGSKAARQAEQSAAGCLLVPPGLDLAGRTVIRVPNPRTAFARAIGRLHPRRRPAAGIHPTAIVSPGAELGEGVSVGPYSVIGERARIGRDTVIRSGCHIGAESTIGDGGLLHDNVTVYDGVEIGRHAIIHSGAVLGADGFGFALDGDHYEKFPQVGRVIIGDDVEIGANSCVDRAALGETRIGDGVKLDNMVHVAHNVRIGKHVVIAAQTGISGGAIIDDYVVIAGQVGIGDKAHVESKAVLGGQSGVFNSKVVRSGEVVWGTPARPYKQALAQTAQLARLGALRDELTALRRRVAELEGK